LETPNSKFRVKNPFSEKQKLSKTAPRFEPSFESVISLKTANGKSILIII